MTEEKINEIKNLLKDNWGKLTSKEIMEGYIDGTYANHEHYNIDEIVAIKKELKSDRAFVKIDIGVKMSGLFILEEAVPATGEEEEVPTVYFEVTNKVDLLASLSSENWNVSDLLAEIMDGKTWTAFKNSF